MSHINVWHFQGVSMMSLFIRKNFEANRKVLQSVTHTSVKFIVNFYIVVHKFFSNGLFTLHFCTFNVINPTQNKIEMRISISRKDCIFNTQFFKFLDLNLNLNMKNDRKKLDSNNDSKLQQWPIHYFYCKAIMDFGESESLIQGKNERYYEIGN